VTTSCFTKVNQRGGTSYPSTNSGWALEIALDVETAHQTCQNCKLILVEADSSSYTNLMAAVDEARTFGARVISNSYGSSEFAGETAYDSHFSHPGTAITFSSVRQWLWSYVSCRFTIRDGCRRHLAFAHKHEHETNRVRMEWDGEWL